MEANFIINLHKRDVELLKLIQTYFGGVGRISKERGGCIDFTISSQRGGELKALGIESVAM